MKQLWVKVLVAVVVLQLGCAAGWGAEAPVVASHQLVAYEEESGSVTVGYTLHVVNVAGQLLSDLKLAFFPLPRLQEAPIMLEVGALDAGQGRDLPVQVKAAAAPSRKAMAERPLIVEGECRDAAGKQLEFSTTSYPGGVR